MNAVICPKCKDVILISKDKDFVICCGEVIYVINVSRDCKNERNS
jgi:hypothetical protein